MLFRQLSEHTVADTVEYNLPKSSPEGRYDSVVSTPFLTEEGRQCDSALIQWLFTTIGYHGFSYTEIFGP